MRHQTKRFDVLLPSAADQVSSFIEMTEILVSVVRITKGQLAA
jgi:hypothetical protein